VWKIHVPLLLNNYSLDVISKIKAEESEWITEDSEGSQENAKTGVSRGIDLSCPLSSITEHYAASSHLNGVKR
jgi:hypothetical protein